MGDPVLPSPVPRGTAPLHVACGPRARATTVTADWYLPRQRPAPGVVWLQHGFTRRRHNLAGLAQAIAHGSGAIVVVPTISSNALSPSGCWINGDHLHQAVAGLFADGRSALQGSADRAAAAAGLPVSPLPWPFVLAGHSAGGNLAVAVAGWTTTLAHDDPSLLRGVVLLDGVDHRDAMGRGLERLSGEHHRPVRTVAAPDARCNANGRGTRSLRRHRPDEFIGVRLEGGTHVDAEGEDGSALAERMCGRPLTRNVDALRGLAAGWVADLLVGVDQPGLLTGTTTGDVSVLPGGATATTL